MNIDIVKNRPDNNDLNELCINVFLLQISCTCLYEKCHFYK